MLVDDNNVTISGHPQEYLDEYDLARTLAGYGLYRNQFVNFFDAGENVKEFRVGDRVAYCLHWSSYAEFAAVPAWRWDLRRCARRWPRS